MTLLRYRRIDFYPKLGMKEVHAIEFVPVLNSIPTYDSNARVAAVNEVARVAGKAANFCSERYGQPGPVTWIRPSNCVATICFPNIARALDFKLSFII